MRKIIVVTLSLWTITVAAAAQRKQEGTDFTKMDQILRAATADLQEKNYRVVFAAEDNRESLELRHWIATVQRYPADYKVIDDQRTRIVFSGPPCHESAVDFCSIKEISGEPLFRGRFSTDDANGHFRRFVGNILGTAEKISEFNKQLSAHQNWKDSEIAAALASAGAKYGPITKKSFGRNYRLH